MLSHRWYSVQHRRAQWLSLQPATVIHRHRPLNATHCSTFLTAVPAARSYTSVPPPASASTAALSPAVGTAGLLGGVVLVGSYLALTVAFARNYALTNYMESKRWLLVMLWPLLFLFSPKFREQFAAAVRGQKAGVKREGNGERL